MAKNTTSDTSFNFTCETCDFKCYKRGDYNRHILTPKHKRLIIPINDYTVSTSNASITSVKEFSCECGKNYKHVTSLYKHKKKCKKVNNGDYTELLLTLINENKELRKMMVDLLPKIGNNNNSHNTINNKQKFNINVFLNEKCKDALTMNEFVDQIDVSIKDLVITKDKGLGEGLSNLIIDNMNKLSLYERPIHCTDKKRETLYVKNDAWEKDENKELVNKLLKNIEKKQMRNINKWTDKNPNYMDNELLQQEYLHLIKGCTTSIDDCKNKIIKNVCDNVYLTEIKGGTAL
jgi:hypothetical protein